MSFWKKLGGPALLVLAMGVCGSANARATETPAARAKRSAEAKTVEKAKKPRSRTLRDIIDLAMIQGRDKTIPPPGAKFLGFGEVELRSRRLTVEMAKSPDGAEHNVNLVSLTSADRPFRAEAILLSILRMTQTQEGWLLDGIEFKSSLDGTLLMALSKHGIPGKLVPQNLRVSDPETKRRFKAELDFHSRVVPRNGIEYMK